ncbi:MAG TPA: hypothetical protein VGH13_07115, partial [Xanthobacteraceae bacterium]
HELQWFAGGPLILTFANVALQMGANVRIGPLVRSGMTFGGYGAQSVRGRAPWCHRPPVQRNIKF